MEYAFTLNVLPVVGGVVIVLVLVHHAVFFSLEALSWAHIVRTIVRTVASGAVSVAFIWVIARIFTAKLPVRI